MGYSDFGEIEVKQVLGIERIGDVDFNIIIGDKNEHPTHLYFSEDSFEELLNRLQELLPKLQNYYDDRIEDEYKNKKGIKGGELGMEYDEMTSEEHADYTASETDRICDEMKDRKAEEYNDTQENFNKITEMVRELTDKKTDDNGKKTLFLALREFLKTEINRLEVAK